MTASRFLLSASNSTIPTGGARVDVIPLYFEPRTLRNERTGTESTLVDGGVLSNFPMEIFDRTDGEDARWPTFGVRVIPTLPGADVKLFPALALPALPPMRELEQVLATAIVGNDQTYMELPCVRRRTIHVDTSPRRPLVAPYPDRDQTSCSPRAAAAERRW
jgi:predicted acylesterase/phospholipase RssA